MTSSFARIKVKEEGFALDNVVYFIRYSVYSLIAILRRNRVYNVADIGRTVGL
jgi:hypothetical protein